MKNKFNRYYFFNIQFCISMLLIHLLTIVAPLSYLISGKNINLLLFFQICIILPLIPSLVYICLGCYWAFQKVVINNEGLEILFFKKCIKKVDWNTILSIEKTSHMKNPALKIELQNAEVIYLDNRKTIRKAIEFYSNRTFFE